jgi:hypothetical protein
MIAAASTMVHCVMKRKQRTLIESLIMVVVPGSGLHWQFQMVEHASATLSRAQSRCHVHHNKCATAIVVYLCAALS